MLEFCPMCKRILQLGEWKGKPAGRCDCGFIRTLGIDVASEEGNNKKEIGFGISQNMNEEGFSFLCSKCGHDRAKGIALGEILGNEKSVTMFTCLKCGNVERI